VSGCHKGGGNPNCRVRMCGKERNVANRSQCAELAECKRLKNGCAT
jgi:hypothetical protein